MKSSVPSITKLEEKVNSLDEELKASKKLKGKPKIRPSTLNQEEKKPQEGEKRAGSDKRSKKKNTEARYQGQNGYCTAHIHQPPVCNQKDYASWGIQRTLFLIWRSYFEPKIDVGDR